MQGERVMVSGEGGPGGGGMMRRRNEAGGKGSSLGWELLVVSR